MNRRMPGGPRTRTIWRADLRPDAKLGTLHSVAPTSPGRRMVAMTTPAHIGPYESAREIGRGGMGVVYLARDTKIDRDVAIKTLPDDPDRLARFEREAKALASLNHSNIASIYGLEEVDGAHGGMADNRGPR